MATTTTDRWLRATPQRQRSAARHRRGRWSGARWASLRRVVFERDGYACVQCGATWLLECDHIVPLRKGGAEWDPSNCQTLCADCHLAKSARESGARPPDPAWRRLVDEARIGIAEGVRA